MNKLTELGNVIAELRHHEGWSQEALAASAGVSTRTIQRLEGGKAANVETVAAVASTLGQNVESLQRIGEWLEVLPCMRFLPRAHIGGDIVSAVRNSAASMHFVESDDRAIRDAALEIVETARDWGDLLDGTIPEQQAEQNLDELLGSLHAVGGKLFYERRPMEDSGACNSHGQPIEFDPSSWWCTPVIHP